MLRGILLAGLAGGCVAPPRTVEGKVPVGPGWKYVLAHTRGGAWEDAGFAQGFQQFRCRGNGGRVVIYDRDGRVSEDWRDLEDGARVRVSAAIVHLFPPEARTRERPASRRIRP